MSVQQTFKRSEISTEKVILVVSGVSKVRSRRYERVVTVRLLPKVPLNEAALYQPDYVVRTLS